MVVVLVIVGGAGAGKLSTLDNPTTTMKRGGRLCGG
jgi:hypothetical protein